MKHSPIHTTMPASLIEFCRMQRMISADDVMVDSSGVLGECDENSSRAVWINRFSSLTEVREGRLDARRATFDYGM